MEEFLVAVFFTFIVLFMGIVIGAGMQENNEEPRPQEEVIESIQEKLDAIDEDLEEIREIQDDAN